MLTCVPLVKIICIRSVSFRFWCWTRFSMLIPKKQFFFLFLFFSIYFLFFSSFSCLFLGDVSTKNPFFSITSPSIGGAKVLSMTMLANVSTKNPYISFTGPSMVNFRVLSMGFISYRSTYGSAMRITAIFNSYTRSSLVVPYGVPIWVSFCLIFTLERSILLYRIPFGIDYFWLRKSDNWSY